MNLVYVFIGGGIGSVIRYVIGLLAQNQFSSLPVGTFVANVSACLLFALFLWIEQNNTLLNAGMRLFILTGICGGLSTFSTFGFETFLLLKQQLLMYAILNIVVSTGLCVAMFFLILK